MKRNLKRSCSEDVNNRCGLDSKNDLIDQSDGKKIIVSNDYLTELIPKGIFMIDSLTSDNVKCFKTVKKDTNESCCIVNDSDNIKFILDSHIIIGNSEDKNSEKTFDSISLNYINKSKKDSIKFTVSSIVDSFVEDDISPKSSELIKSHVNNEFCLESFDENSSINEDLCKNPITFISVSSLNEQKPLSCMGIANVLLDDDKERILKTIENDNIVTKNDTVEHQKGFIKENIDSNTTCPFMKHLIENGSSIELAELFSEHLIGVLDHNEITREVVVTANSMSQKTLLDALVEFAESDFFNLVDKTSHLISILKSWQEESASCGGEMIDNPIHNGPDPIKLSELLERTNYFHEVNVTYRLYGPPSNWEGKKPNHSNEVFVTNIPFDLYEDEFVPIIESLMGENSIYDLRLIIDPNSGLNRGFAFIRFQNKDLVEKCIEKLTNFEVPSKGNKLKVSQCFPNLRLQITNIPKSKSKEELLEEFSKYISDIKNIVVTTSAEFPLRKNCGFCFLDFEDYNMAFLAKTILSKDNFYLYNNEIGVNWTDVIYDDVSYSGGTYYPLSIMYDPVKVVCVTDFNNDLTEKMLRDKFALFGQFEKVPFKTQDIAYIFYKHSEDAVRAQVEMNGKMIGTSKITVILNSDLMSEMNEENNWNDNSFSRTSFQKIQFPGQSQSIMYPRIPGGILDTITRNSLRQSITTNGLGQIFKGIRNISNSGQLYNSRNNINKEAQSISSSQYQRALSCAYISQYRTRPPGSAIPSQNSFLKNFQSESYFHHNFDMIIEDPNGEEWVKDTFDAW